MEKITKRVCMFFVCVALSQTLSVNGVFAKEDAVIQKIDETSSQYVTANVYTNYDMGENIELNKTWNIKFNQPMNENSLEDNIKILNKKSGQPLEFKVSPGKDFKNISVTANYEPDTVYSLIVDKNIKSKRGDTLKESVTVNFKTEGKIKSIENITLTVNQNEKVDFPTVVKAIMNDGKSKEVKVEWDKQFEGTEKAGKYTYVGTVNGYSEKVTLDLTVKQVDTNKEDTEDKSDGDVNQKSHSPLHENLVKYLSSEDNRNSVMDAAIELHDGDASNTCVYFASEALRRAGLSDLPESTCNTLQLTRELEARGWTKSTDLTKLCPGDICFTISYGYGPTHAYTFMKWVDPKSYKYAYICDNQGNEYGSSYHQRSINFATSTKDPISYFMYRP